jgi:4-hydroxy-4-methyl-2-oxoglutarate aldolase
MFICNPRVEGVSKELRAMFNEVCPSTVGHMTDFGFLKGLTPLLQDFHFVGNAITVQLPHVDAVAMHYAVKIAKAGDVILVDMSGDTERACLGEIVAYAAKIKKVAAVIIDGCITDLRALRKMNLPVFSRGVSPVTTRSLGIEGAINVTVSICGVSVKPGDLVVGDDDGVFVIDPANAEDFGRRAIQKQNGEPATKEKIDSGMELADINGNSKYFE